MLKKTIYTRGRFVALFLLVLPMLTLAAAPTLEDIHARFVQGDYQAAERAIQELLETNPSPQTVFEMQDKIGMRAFLEMSQNQFLQDGMKILSSMAWQHERTQFKNPRRIDYYLTKYLEDESLRQKALSNLVASGVYAMPGLVEHLGSKEKKVIWRGLCFQAVRRIGREAVPALVQVTFSKDPILLVNAVRLLGETSDPRAVPYLMRLAAVAEDKIVKDEAASALQKLKPPKIESPARHFISEAIRYLGEERDVLLESITSDGLLWKWDDENQKLVSVNVIDQDFEYHPTLPNFIWPIFRAEMILQELNRMETSPTDSMHARAALVCAWIAEEIRTEEVLAIKDNEQVERIREKLKAFLETRKKDVEVLHWTGTQTMLAALDISLRVQGQLEISRMLQILTEYKPQNLLSFTAPSFFTGEQVQPCINAMAYPFERVRYWSAIAIGRAHPALKHEKQDLIFDLLFQAVDEVAANTVLIVGQLTDEIETLRSNLEKLGYKVYHENSGFGGLNAIRMFPSKDIVLMDHNLSIDLSSQEFINRMRADFKGRDIPVGIVTPESSLADTLAGFQDHAQQVILYGEIGESLKGKMRILEKSMQVQTNESEVVHAVSREALKSLLLMEDATLRQYDGLILHLISLLENPFHSREHEVLAVNILGKFGKVAYNATPILLNKLWDPATDDSYKLAVLTTMRETSTSHPGVRKALGELVSNRQVKSELRLRAASFLGLDEKLIEEEQKKEFQKPFFSNNFNTEQ